MSKKGIDFSDDPGLTVQSEADACDINVMMKTYQKTGMVPQTQQQPLWGDFSNVVDYMEAKQIQADAESYFDALPAEMRKRFNNNPAELLAFMQDANNQEEAEQIGLVQKPPPPPPRDTDIELETPASEPSE